MFFLGSSCFFWKGTAPQLHEEAPVPRTLPDLALHTSSSGCSSVSFIEPIFAWNVPLEATVRTGHGTTDWFQIGKGGRQDCILLPCLFNLYAEYIMWNVGLDEVQAGMKIAGRNINNLRYADDTSLMAESEEEPKSLLMNVKRGVKKLA